MRDGATPDVRDYGPVSLPLWRALRAADGPLTIAALHKLIGADKNAIAHRIRNWRRVGFITVTPATARRFAIAPGSQHLETAPTQGPLSRDAWAALRRLGGAGTFAEILAECGADDRPLYCRLRRWKSRKHLIVSPAVKQSFSLSPQAPAGDVPPKVPVDGRVVSARSGKDRMWAAMRILKTFDMPLLLITAEVNIRQATEFVSMLCRADYVRKVDQPMSPSKASPTGMVRSHATYRLIRNTGAKTPSTSNGGTTRHPSPYLLDRNLNELIELPWVRPRQPTEIETSDGR